MKNLIKTIFILIIIFFSINIIKAQTSEKNNKRYHIESAYIKYEITGNSVGAEDLYFDHWGEREMNIIKSITKTTFYGITNTQKENSLNILDGDLSYSIDLDKKTGVKTLNAGFTTMSSLGNGKSPRQFGKEMLEKIGGKKIGEEEILGKNCEIWTALGVKVWLWKGIALKTYSKMLGIKRIREATEIVIDFQVDETKFIVPKDIKIVDYTGKN